jgi:phenylpyruvate tautomerase PptA (4-oxalocrotonate tautomerase family)
VHRRDDGRTVGYIRSGGCRSRYTCVEESLAAAFVHELPSSGISNVQGDSTYVRIQVLTNAGALDRAKQLAVVSRFSTIAAEAAGDASLAERTWVLLTEATEGGWGLAGHANTNEELVAAARAQIAELKSQGKP